MTLVSPFIYKPRTGLRQKIHNFLFFNFLNSPAIKLFVVFAKAEVNFYLNTFGQKFKNKIFFVPFGVHMPLSNNEKEKLEIDSLNKNKEEIYFFSGGASNRDYFSLVNAFRQLNEKLKIICSPKNIKGLKIPKNVAVSYNIFENEFLTYMKKAYSVIITLNQIPISSGQLVLLNAMRLGKPIIITKHEGVIDYLDEECAIFLNSNSPQDIITAIRKLVYDRELFNILGLKARQKYERNFTTQNYAERIADLLISREKC